MLKTSDIKENNKIRIMLGQINFIVGDLRGNQIKINEIVEIAQKNEIDLLVFPEMALTGYPIQDLIFDRDFFESEQKILKEIAKTFPDITLIIGGFNIESDPNHHPQYQNVAFVLSKGEISNIFSKRLIPTYDVFDEKRYFWEGENFLPYTIKGLKFGIAICEDLWEKEYQLNVAEKLVENGAEVIISINGSPYIIGKQKIRENLIKQKALEYKIPIAYLNLIGGEDELVFDGRSFVLDKHGRLTHRASFCKESLIFFEISTKTREINYIDHSSLKLIPKRYEYDVINPISDLFNENEEIVQAMAMNLRDYFYKTGIFNRIVVGLSGGIDSAFTTYISVKAVGKEKVTAILMPSRFSSQGSLDDSIELCKNLDIEYIIFSIKDSHLLLENQLQNTLKGEYSEQDNDIANQNLQSRLRGIILMYYSNKFKALLVSTGNKSEIATGYCTLYGDTNGGKNVPGDLYKTQLYRVVNWINKNNEVIPINIVNKPPSAELKENQIDEDNLPPYKDLDEILALRIDEGLSPREIIKLGKDPNLVFYIERLYSKSEFKRAQLVQTIKINKKAFGMGRKIPILKKPSY